MVGQMITLQALADADGYANELLLSKAQFVDRARTCNIIDNQLREHLRRAAASAFLLNENKTASTTNDKLTDTTNQNIALSISFELFQQ